MRGASTSNHNRKLRLRDVCHREGKSERTIARDVERGHLPPPHYDETGHRYWYERDLDANDQRVEALNLGPKHRPPPPTPRRKPSKAKPRIATHERAEAKQAEADISLGLGDILRVRKAASAPTRAKVERALRRALKPVRPDTAEARKADRRKGEMRDAIRAAERKVDDAWFATRKAAEKRPLEDKRQELNAAIKAAHAAAREEIQARWDREDAEAAQSKVKLPAHIIRVAAE